MENWLNINLAILVHFATEVRENTYATVIPLLNMSKENQVKGIGDLWPNNYSHRSQTFGGCSEVTEWCFLFFFH